MSRERIEIIIKGSLNKITGYDFGHDVYIKQVKEIIDFSRKYVIIFPDHVVDVGISFVQGFTEEIIKKIGRKGFYDRFTIEASDNEIVEKFLKGIKRS